MNVFQDCITRRITHFQELVDIYTDKFNDSHCGYVLKVSDELIMLETFDTDDMSNDGIKVIRLEDIDRIRWGGNIRQRLNNLINKGTKDISLNNVEISNININNIREALESIHKKYGYVTVHIQEVDDEICFIGEIEALDDSALLLKEFGTRETLDRSMLVLKIGNITRIDAGGKYDESIKNIYLK